MKIALLLTTLLLNCGNGIKPATVYICNSPNAKKYHHSDKCRGLSNCGYKIIEVTLDKAKKDGRTLCGWED